MFSEKRWRIEILVKRFPHWLGNAAVLGPVVIYRAGWRSPSLEDWARRQIFSLTVRR